MAYPKCRRRAPLRPLRTSRTRPSRRPPRPAKRVVCAVPLPRRPTRPRERRRSGCKNLRKSDKGGSVQSRRRGRGQRGLLPELANRKWSDLAPRPKPPDLVSAKGRQLARRASPFGRFRGGESKMKARSDVGSGTDRPTLPRARRSGSSRRGGGDSRVDSASDGGFPVLVGGDASPGSVSPRTPSWRAVLKNEPMSS